MEYRIYKLRFKGMVHLGNTGLEDANHFFYADTLFSALCHEAIKAGNDSLERLYELAHSGRLGFSDAFPYIGNEYYIPKPYLKIESDNMSGDSNVKKAYKKLKYIPVSELGAYLKGEYDVLNTEASNTFGKSQLKTSVSIRGEDETQPYRVGMYSFNENSGLYIIVSYDSDDTIDFAEQLLESLSYSGIGGKRNSGLGRFDLVNASIPDVLKERLDADGKTYMVISACLPKDGELDTSMTGAHYALIKRSGFVMSDTYADEQMRKRDIYIFKSGSCFSNKFEGDIYDVSTASGRHPVYRYAKPMFLEVDV